MVQVSGKRIRSLREAKQMTQAQLAQKIGLKETMITKIERGHSAGSIRTLCRIAAVFGVSVVDLLEEPGEAVTPDDAA